MSFHVIIILVFVWFLSFATQLRLETEKNARNLTKTAANVGKKDRTLNIDNKSVDAISQLQPPAPANSGLYHEARPNRMVQKAMPACVYGQQWADSGFPRRTAARAQQEQAHEVLISKNNPDTATIAVRCLAPAVNQNYEQVQKLFITHIPNSEAFRPGKGYTHTLMDHSRFKIRGLTRLHESFLHRKSINIASGWGGFERFCHAFGDQLPSRRVSQFVVRTWRLYKPSCLA